MPSAQPAANALNQECASRSPASNEGPTGEPRKINLPRLPATGRSRAEPMISKSSAEIGVTRLKSRTLSRVGQR